MRFGKKNADAKIEQERRDRLIQYKQLFGSPQGKVVLFDIIDRCHILDERELTPFEQGKRSVATRLLTDLNINLSEFDRMMKGDNE